MKKTFNICVRYYNILLDYLFYLPCDGEVAFRRKCLEFASLLPRDSVLDVCCGAGELTSLIAKQRLAIQTFGVDISESALKIARTKTPHIPATFLRASADHLPFNSSRFDKCFICFGLHHMVKRQRQQALLEIYRVLAPKGTLYVIDYNLPERGFRRLAAIAFAKLDKSKEAYRMVKNRGLAEEIRQADFEIKRQCLTCRSIIQLLEVVKK